MLQFLGLKLTTPAARCPMWLPFSCAYRCRNKGSQQSLSILAALPSFASGSILQMTDVRKRTGTVASSMAGKARCCGNGRFRQLIGICRTAIFDVGFGLDANLGQSRPDNRFADTAVI